MAYVKAAVRRGAFVAAARTALARHGVEHTTLRKVAAEAGVSLGTLQYVFPSKQELLRAVIEDVVDEIAAVLASSSTLDQGLAHAVRAGVTTFWSQLVTGHRDLQLMQYELTTHSLRAAGLADLARWQYERYAEVVAQWCEDAAEHAGEELPMPADRLARLVLACLDGLILQHVCDPDEARATDDLDAMLEMILASLER